MQFLRSIIFTSLGDMLIIDELDMTKLSNVKWQMANGKWQMKITRYFELDSQLRPLDLSLLNFGPNVI